MKNKIISLLFNKQGYCIGSDGIIFPEENVDDGIYETQVKILDIIETPISYFDGITIEELIGHKNMKLFNGHHL